MEIRTVRKPGDRGTQSQAQTFGKHLICVRYRDRHGWRELEQCRSNCRYDSARKECYKTVELIVTEEDWQPPEPHPDDDHSTQAAPKRYTARRLGIRIGFGEAELRQCIKAVGGLWDPAQRLWFVPEKEVRRLGLVQWVVKR